MKTTKVYIDVSEFRKWLKEINISQCAMSREMSGHKSSISNALTRGWMSNTLFNLVTLKYNGDPQRLKKKPEPTKTQLNPVAKPDAIGYATSINVYPNKVRFAVIFNGVEIFHAYSKVKGHKEVDLVQAISYAAHMCYKQAEQNDLEG